MKRTSINPAKWGLNFKLDQGEVIEGTTKHLRCSGQTSVKDDPSSPMGFSIVSANDMRGQITQALANVNRVLDQAGMSKSNIAMIRFYTTDTDALLENYDVYIDWITPASICPPNTLLGIQRLASPELMVEIEIEAVA